VPKHVMESYYLHIISMASLGAGSGNGMADRRFQAYLFIMKGR
jgi:hypothetical protein